MDAETVKQRAKAFDYLFDAVVVTDTNGVIVDWNAGSEALYGYTKAEALGQAVSILHVPEDSAQLTARVIDAVAREGKWTGEIRMLRKDGYIGWVESMCVPIFDDDGTMIGALGINRDISDRKAEQARLSHLAHYDQLTSIPNRYLLLDRVSHLIEQSKRSEKSFTLLFIDLDKFKSINDTHGHGFGDLVLREFAARIKSCIRASDTVARIGGDEFVILLEDASGKANVGKIAQALIDAVDKPFHIAGQQLQMSCSIGVANYPDDGCSTDELLAVADKAMYRAKGKSCSSYEF
ncbi:sensor domain-containing diguanylate cyclase [Simiduia curdlanivorans]|uniref:Diguanylate cyclase domain-containing protein n=1 Tax=Simiduia curdlanivorans TaxID=1492769 RepID=A0ABV8V5X1_9GAMM|nr:sensor domain-containing diguanylate cyclase [Simiduia curdlanivorans]MDN3638660.1 sensor domain-containing diguanylate cyclase [Simiduia curdlanivorans]